MISARASGLVLALATLAWNYLFVHGFTVPSSLSTSAIVPKTAITFQVASQLGASVDVGIDQDQEQQQQSDNELMRRDRYVATNRFSVRQDQQAKFEKRWATRKSRLATLDGFRYFHLMRRVSLNEDGTNTYKEGTDNDSAFGNYVSFTIWEKKDQFQEWRQGEAFKEAHGGTSIGAFVSTMINSAFVLRGPPRPAFYDGLLLQSTVPQDVPTTVDGWRAVEADGVTTLPAECFVACNQFYVSSANAAAFEERWANRESTLREYDGFVAFSMLRRDVGDAGMDDLVQNKGEPSYMSTTIWRDRQAFDNWKAGSFGKAHDGSKAKSKVPPGPPLWSQPPQPVFYEGTLVISSQDGP